ncbi:TPA: hypothetical protein N0F65_006692 [Lagenidium giganteum]|uniref:Uncharacterized protein n=1 Tax=Lagenidium giganteum TaxID=4803 RepID=A0AAV2Z7F3_9STRA|nr:TPA: hypothetical protein N0F65_006692 [Lagenidium giganteum]
MIAIHYGLWLLLSADSPYFFHVHVVREAIEVIAQTYQAYIPSYLVGSPTVNHALVLSLCLCLIAGRRQQSTPPSLASADLTE